jgi:hypothetical protein
MVEAARGFRLYTTYILDVYNVFEHLDICCGWAYGCTLTLIPVQVGVNFGKLGGVGAQMTLGCYG